MSDIGDMLREALIDEEPYRPAADQAVLEEACKRFGARLRSVRILGAVMVIGPSLFTVLGFWLVWNAADGTERVIGALLTLFGLGAAGMGKMWFHNMVHHVQVMKELTLTQLAVARLAERIGEEESTVE